MEVLKQKNLLTRGSQPVVSKSLTICPGLGATVPIFRAIPPILAEIPPEIEDRFHVQTPFFLIVFFRDH